MLWARPAPSLFQEAVVQRHREFVMARIIGAIATSHTPTIGFAYDRNKQDDPVWAPIFEA